jgi:hypothetical protein
MVKAKSVSAVKRAPKGADAAKAIPGYTEKQKIGEDFTASLGTFRDALSEVIGRLAPNGYMVRAEQGGEFCGFSVYRLEAPEDLPGLLPDPNFQMYRKVGLHDAIARDQFYADLDLVIAELRDQTDNKTLKRDLLTVLQDLKDKPGNIKSNTGQASAGFYEAAGHMITLTGRNGLCKIVPPREWFSEEVQAINARDLLTLWPDAEAEMLMLMLGRVMVGPKDEAVSEGVIHHTMRSYGISVGHEPGLGKSTFLGWLIGTLEYLGYTTEPVNLRLGVFGWGPVASADLAYVDDLSDDGQRELMQLGLIKSIVSGHTIKAEEKGLAAVKVNSRCVLLGCSNGSDPSNFIGMDPGSINRCNQLYTRTSSELTDAYGPGDHRLKQRWEALSESLNTEPTVLMAWLLRSSVDLFLQTSGHSISDRGVVEYEPDRDGLENRVRELRGQFVIKVNLDHAESLISAILHGLAVYRATLEGDKAREFDEYFIETDFSPSLVLDCLEHQADRKALQGWDGLQVRGLSRACLEYISPKLPAYRNKAATMSLPELFKAVMGELVSVHGFKYPGTLTFYNPKWATHKRYFYPLVEIYKKRISSEKLPDAVAKLAEDLGSSVF